jgi:ribosomal protein S18 acetylase RimI-like enzyme
MATANLEYRVATAEDASFLQEMVQAGFRASDSRAGWTGDLPQLNENFTMNINSITTEINNPDGVIIIATDSSNNGVVAACFDIVKKGDDLARFAWFVVAQKYQQRGLGRQVLAYAEEHAQRTWSVSRMELNALSNRQELIAWYMRNGYQKTGVTVPFPTEAHPVKGLPEDLGFVMLEKQLATVVTT